MNLSFFCLDSIHTERYMTLLDQNPDGYEKCNILNANLQNFKNVSFALCRNFIIHELYQL